MPFYNPESQRYDFDLKVSIDDIKEYFRQYNNGPFFSMFETGLNSLRFDLIRVDPYRRYVRIFEFKSCRQDFVSDNKWQKYLPYCHTFTFVCPIGVIQKDDLPSGIGLLSIYKWKWKQNERWILNSEWIKRPKKRDVDQGVLLNLAFMLVHRTIWRKDDVF